VLTLVVAASVSLSAHRRDEYLQAARLALEPARVTIQLDLTAGIAVADAVLAAIDRDRSGTISPEESRAYAGFVLESISLEADGEPLHLEVTDRRFPVTDAVRRGEGPIRLELSAEMPPLPAGPHSLRYRNAHRPDIGVYLANVLVPASQRIAISAQRRDVDQRELRVDFVLRADSSAKLPAWFLPIAFAILAAVATLSYRASRETSSMR
jgi:hypothetical protein